MVEPEILKFPQGFLWGASNSAFQSEGGEGVTIPNSDWEVWAKKVQPARYWPDKSSGHYIKFKEDFELLKSLGHNVYRFGIEWARIEPEPGRFDQREIDHYKEVVETLGKLKLKPLVTLLHFTHPAWFAQMGGWENKQSPLIFERFVSKVTAELGDIVDFWITVNEPNTYAAFAYLSAEFPPQKKNPILAFKVFRNLAKAHNRAYAVIKDKYPDSQVGFSNAVVGVDAYHPNLAVVTSFEQSLASLFFQLNHAFYWLTDKSSHDFIGLQYYESRAVKLQKQFPWIIQGKLSQERTSLGWTVYPKGLYDILQNFSKYKKPIYITENGIATNDDRQRARYLIHHVKSVYEAIQKGVDVRGYFYWSAFDNMELHRGYDPRFGLIGVDFETGERTPKPSAKIYQQIIENNGVPVELLVNHPTFL